MRMKPDGRGNIRRSSICVFFIVAILSSTVLFYLYIDPRETNGMRQILQSSAYSPREKHLIQTKPESGTLSAKEILAKQTIQPNNTLTPKTINVKQSLPQNGAFSQLENQVKLTGKPPINSSKDLNIYPNSNSFTFFSDHPFLIFNKSVCGNSKDISLIILIHSAPKHFEYRNAIRRTWASYNTSYHLSTFRRVFLFGKVSLQPLQAQLEKEHSIHGDLLQSNFIDSYQNLSLNTLHGLKWVQEYCRGAKVVMKVDDDIIIDMFNVMPQIVYKYSSLRRHVFCNQLNRSPIYRNLKSKFVVKANQFKDLRFFPPYCEGKTVIFTSDLIIPILQQAAHTPMFWIEDVYVYGLVLNRIPNLVIDKYAFDVNLARHCKSNCIQTDKECRKVMAELKRNIPEQFANIWTVFQQRRDSCPNVTTSYLN